MSVLTRIAGKALRLGVGPAVWWLWAAASGTYYFAVADGVAKGSFGVRVFTGLL